MDHSIDYIIRKEIWTFEKLDLPDLVKQWQNIKMQNAQEIIKLTSFVRNEFPAQKFNICNFCGSILLLDQVM